MIWLDRFGRRFDDESVDRDNMPACERYKSVYKCDGRSYSLTN